MKTAIFKPKGMFKGWEILDKKGNIYRYNTKKKLIYNLKRFLYEN
jgi:hypothetical protein